VEILMRLAVLTLLTALAHGSAAYAQNGAPPALPGGPPLLHLSETATIQLLPTLLVADLVTNATSRTAVTAPRQVNELMAKAQAIAGVIPGVTAVFADYETDFTAAGNGVPAQWEASQTLEVSGHVGGSVLRLVGQLQALRLSIGTLGWQVPQDQADAAGRNARMAALAMLRAEAGQAAQTLGLAVAGYQSVDLSGGPTPIFGQAQAAPVPQMAAMAPPLASASRQDVTDTVTADVILAGPTTPAQNAQP
jgi:uncharacterized protein YggE